MSCFVRHLLSFLHLRHGRDLYKFNFFQSDAVRYVYAAQVLRRHFSLRELTVKHDGALGQRVAGPLNQSFLVGQVFYMFLMKRVLSLSVENIDDDYPWKKYDLPLVV